jgi:ABC-type lipoprotein export system ATPase subunit
MVTHDPAIADHATRQITIRDGQVECDTSLTPDGLLTMADSEVLHF